MPCFMSFLTLKQMEIVKFIPNSVDTECESDVKQACLLHAQLLFIVQSWICIKGVSLLSEESKNTLKYSVWAAASPSAKPDIIV